MKRTYLVATGSPNFEYSIIATDDKSYRVSRYIVGETAYYPNGRGPWIVGEAMSQEQVNDLLRDNRLYVSLYGPGDAIRDISDPSIKWTEYVAHVE